LVLHHFIFGLLLLHDRLDFDFRLDLPDTLLNLRHQLGQCTLFNLQLQETSFDLADPLANWLHKPLKHLVFVVLPVLQHLGPLLLCVLGNQDRKLGKAVILNFLLFLFFLILLLLCLGESIHRPGHIPIN